MLKSLMLAVACAYINPPGLEPNAPVVQATVPEILKQAYAMKPGTQKEIIIDHGDGLCSKVMIEPSTDEALNAFIDPGCRQELCRAAAASAMIAAKTWAQTSCRRDGGA